MPSRRFLAVAVAAGVGVVLASLGLATPGSGEARAPGATLRLGHFANLTHGTAIAGLETGSFARALGPTVKLDTKVFNAGPAAVEALFSGAIDAAYIGPNPAINAFTKSRGEAIRVIAGATSGGAAFVVAPAISSASDLRGRKVASPQLGGTQDIALRAWLRANDLRTDLHGGGDVAVVAQQNAVTLTAFSSGDIAGAWVPEPWASRLVIEGGGKVLVNEADLWPGGRFVTTQLVVRTDFLTEHPDLVEALLRGHVEANELLNGNPDEGSAVVSAGLARLTGARLAPEVLDAAWNNLTFTNDPLGDTLAAAALHAEQAGVLKDADVDGIHDLRLLDGVVRARARSEVSPS